MIRECGAKARSNNHQPCRRIAMANGRCHLHGGIWTGARTMEGKLRQKMASWKHGMRSREAIEERRALRAMMNEHKHMLREIPSFGEVIAREREPSLHH